MAIEAVPATAPASSLRARPSVFGGLFLVRKGMITTTTYKVQEIGVFEAQYSLICCKKAKYKTLI